MFNYPVWTWICIGVGIMSGIGSIARDILEVYHPTEQKHTKKVFWAVIRIAFLVSAFLIWYAEHQNVVSLNNQLDSKRHQVYSDMLEERERIVNLYKRGWEIDKNIVFLSALDKKQKRLVNANIVAHYVFEKDKWVKEKDEEKARFIKLLAEAKLLFNSSEMNRLARSAFPSPNYDHFLKGPQEQDLKDQLSIQKWIDSTSLANNKEIDSGVGLGIDLILDLMENQMKQPITKK